MIHSPNFNSDSDREIYPNRSRAHHVLNDPIPSSMHVKIKQKKWGEGKEERKRKY